MAESKFNGNFTQKKNFVPKSKPANQLIYFTEKTEDWKGNWFPAPPGQIVPLTPQTTVSKEHVEDSRLTKMGVNDDNCDDGMVLETVAVAEVQFFLF